MQSPAITAVGPVELDPVAGSVRPPGVADPVPDPTETVDVGAAGGELVVVELVVVGAVVVVELVVVGAVVVVELVVVGAVVVVELVVVGAVVVVELVVVGAVVVVELVVVGAVVVVELVVVGAVVVVELVVVGVVVVVVEVVVVVVGGGLTLHDPGGGAVTTCLVVLEIVPSWTSKIWSPVGVRS